jgi:hypothetical protein
MYGTSEAHTQGRSLELERQLDAPERAILGFPDKAQTRRHRGYGEEAIAQGPSRLADAPNTPPVSTQHSDPNEKHSASSAAAVTGW